MSIALIAAIRWKTTNTITGIDLLLPEFLIPKAHKIKFLLHYRHLLPYFTIQKK